MRHILGHMDSDSWGGKVICIAIISWSFKSTNRVFWGFLHTMSAFQIGSLSLFSGN